MYLIIKHIHLTSVGLTIALFLLRYFWKVTRPHMLEKRWVRTLPHIIDTALLGSAIYLTTQIQQYPFTHSWLTAKVIALCFYIIFGTLCLKRCNSKFGQNLAFFLALATIGYIITVALQHDPIPWRGH